MSSSPHALSRLSRLLFLLGALGLALGIGYFSLSSPESRTLAAQLGDWLSRLERGEVMELHVSLVGGEGLPKALEGRSAALRWQTPDKLRLEARHDEGALLAGREGNRLWIHLPEKSFAVIGEDSVPRFAGDPDSVLPAKLPDFTMPLSSWQCRFLPLLLEVGPVTDASGEPGWTRLSPSRLGRRFLDLPASSLEWRAGPEQSVEFRVPLAKAALRLQVDRFALRPATSGDPAWAPSSEVEASAERVALSHLLRCGEVLRSRLGAKTPPLPPATGQRELVATSGLGRLERHDGVRVLFLEGEPEEMGRQQGELLRAEVREVVDRILYGVGVGSSFPKGRWFFGEIEEAQSRVQPFVSEPHLREMDALGAAAGLHPREARLANFFPELFHCSGFALHGSATRDGRLYHGRILDYIRGAGLEDNAVVVVYRPSKGHAWVNVTYAGFIGSVTAMNEKQLAIGEMGGRGEGHWDGKPMAQLVREVMEHCDTIDEAVAWMRSSPRTCEYYYVISDAKSGRAVGIKATPEIFETIWSGESHPQLPEAVEDAVILSAGDRYTELVRRVKAGFGRFDAESARELMTRPVCMTSNIQSVLFAPDSLDFWVANADSENVASHTRYTRFNLAELLGQIPPAPAPAPATP